MERSNQPVGLFKGRYTSYRPKHIGVRCTDIESYLDDRDTYEPVVRYVDSKSAVRAEQREWAFVRSVGRKAGVSEDKL